VLVGADANGGSSLLHSLHGVLHLEEAALRGPGRHIVVVKIAKLTIWFGLSRGKAGQLYHFRIDVSGVKLLGWPF